MEAYRVPDAGDKENDPGVGRNKEGVDGGGTPNIRKGKEIVGMDRVSVNPSQTKNRKKNAVDMDTMENHRPSKR